MYQKALTQAAENKDAVSREAPATKDKNLPTEPEPYANLRGSVHPREEARRRKPPLQDPPAVRTTRNSLAGCVTCGTHPHSPRFG